MMGGLSGKEKGIAARLRRSAPQGSAAKHLREPRFFRKSEVPPNPLLEKWTDRVRTAHPSYSLRKQTTGSWANNRLNTEKFGKLSACATAASILALTGSAAISGKVSMDLSALHHRPSIKH
jgi:hypothetical protein